MIKHTIFESNCFTLFSFPGATNETLLQKFNTVHKDNTFYKKPQKKEAAFIVEHYAGKVKYQVKYRIFFVGVTY